jgi:hypothetical protein
MQKSARILGALGLVALAVWGWWVLFPGAERVIRSRLKELAAVGSFRSNEGALAKAYNSSRLGSYFTADTVISVDIPGRGMHTLEGRDSLVQAAMVFRQNLSGVKIEFLDIHVTLADDKQTAVANLTGKATVSGERDFSVQEFKFKLKKVKGEWLIYRVESVKTLTFNKSSSFSKMEMDRGRGRGRAGNS